MASTRNNNTPGDYCLQQKSYQHSLEYNEFKNSQVGSAYKNSLPTLGITPSHMPREAFSQNSVEIESALFGINSTNLVNPQKPVVPELKYLPSVSYFEKLPNFMPEPLVVEKNQRPFPVPK
uniref:Uncharacterized protein n=1 Tax=viral metagenome TaxID=1070528 RepID=A0A6C0CJ26_9ZZZZ